MNHACLRGSMRSPPIVIGCAILALGLLATQARAQAPDAQEKQRSALYKEGLAFAETGRWNEALLKFQKVVAIRSAPPALIALATAQEKSGQFASAKKTYTKARADARAAGDDPLARRSDAALAALAARVPRVVVRLPLGVVNAQVTLDGTPMQPTAQGIEVDPGEHLVAASAPGRQPFNRRFQIREGQEHQVLVELGSAGVTSSAPALLSPSHPDDDDAGTRTTFPTASVILGGAGGLLAAVGVIVRIIGQSDYDEASVDCPENRCQSQEVASRGNLARERMIAGTVMAGAGLASIAGAGIWWGLSSSLQKPGPSNSLSVRAAPAADAYWIRLTGHF